MRIAVVADIHANRFALHNFLSFLRDNADIEHVLNAGDTVGTGPHPQEALDLVLSDKRFCSVLGNNDEAILECFLQNTGENLHRKWAATRIGDKLIAELGKVPLHQQITLGNKKIFMSHARPCSTNEFPLILTNHTAKELLADYNGKPDIVIFGHTHTPFIAKFENTLFINPGALGVSKISYSNFAILTIEDDEIGIEIQKIEWDRNALAADFIKRNVPDKEFIMERFYNLNCVMEL